MKDSIRNRIKRQKDTLHNRLVDIDVKELVGAKPKPLPAPNEFAAEQFRRSTRQRPRPIGLISRLIQLFRQPHRH